MNREDLENLKDNCLRPYVLEHCVHDVLKLIESYESALKVLEFYCNGRDEGKILGVEYSEKTQGDVFIGERARKFLEGLE